MAAYVSARFEKDELPTSEQVRIVVRNLDHGSVPPSPSVTYFPTDPDELQDFLAIEYVNDTLGESLNRVASLSDITSLTVRTLTVFEDTAADFLTAGVSAGDILEVFVTPAERWTSEEFPGSVFEFEISNVLSATQLTVSRPFPVFTGDLSWEISAASITGTTGITRREGSPAPGSIFLDKRFNSYFDDAVAAENFVTFVKASLTTLANESTGSDLTSESYTAEPTE